MEERIDSENVQQIDLISMLKDIGREWITILLLSVAAALFADIWICATYQPEYKTSTTFVVTAKGMNSNIYQNFWPMQVSCKAIMFLSFLISVIFTHSFLISRRREWRCFY